MQGEFFHPFEMSVPMSTCTVYRNEEEAIYWCNVFADAVEEGWKLHLRPVWNSADELEGFIITDGTNDF